MKAALCIAIAILQLGTLASARAPVQKNAQLVDVSFERIPIRIALQELFRKIDAKFTMEPTVQGTVTVSLKRVAFETALANTLRQVDATWREQNGIYVIVLKTHQVPFNAPKNPKEPVDVRIALSQLFSASGTAFTISPEVRGKVLQPRSEATFETTLGELLKQVDAAYRVEDGIFEVFPRRSPQLLFGNFPVSLTLDRKFLFVTEGETIFKLDLSELKVVASNQLQRGPESRALVSLEERGADVREVLRRLFRQNGASYSVDPEISGFISIGFQEILFSDALERVSRAAGAAVRYEAGIYQIFKPKLRVGGGPLHDLDAGTPVIAQNDSFLFMYRSGSIHKIDKKTLKTILVRSLHS